MTRKYRLPFGRSIFGWCTGPMDGLVVAWFVLLLGIIDEIIFMNLAWDLLIRLGGAVYQPKGKGIFLWVTN